MRESTNSNPRKTILVTGAAGFMGSHLVRHLLWMEKFHIVALDDLSGGRKENLPSHPALEFIQGSITDALFVEKLFENRRFKYVYHLAAYAAEGLSHFIRRYNYTNNVIGSVNLINESIRHGVESFIFTSSIAVYGRARSPLTEDTVPSPQDPYGIAKYAVELDLKAAHETHGLNYVVFRPHNVYGEYQNIGDRYRNVVGIFMNQILQNRPMTIFGNGNQQRAFTYVGDIIPALAAAAWKKQAHGQVFNIGADVPYTVNALADAVARAMDVPNHPVQHLPARKEAYIAYSDHSRIHRCFGVYPQTSLEKGLSRMADWVRRVGARETAEFHAIEIRKNLPVPWAIPMAD